jgi:hypothetical protein
MSIKEGEEVQAKRIQNIFNKYYQKIPKSQERVIHSGIGSLQDSKQTCPK